MSNSHEEFAFLFGRAPELPAGDRDFLVAARVIGEERGLYRVQWSMTEIRWANAAGRLQYEAASRADFPAVGDWVWLEVPADSDRAIIHGVAPRTTVLTRKQVGPTSDIQILSANVDTMFIATSITDDLNFRRLDRYLAVAREAGVRPVIVLTKADTASDPIETVIEAVRREFSDTDVQTLSKDSFADAEFLPRYLQPGMTSVIVGSSGVGKSTLVNYLIGTEEHIRTQAIRESDGRGRHTTTARSLYVSRYGGLIIDTPGMRELHLSDHLDGVTAQFSEIEDLASRCRFGNCRHEREPGCAIQAALEAGDLSPERWNSYRKLEAEARFEARKHNKALASEERKQWAKRSALGKSHRRMKRGED